MTPTPEDMAILQNLEFMVISVWKENPEMTDHAVARAYEAVFEHYRAEARGHRPKPVTVAGVDRVIYERLAEMCETRLGRRPPEDSFAGLPTVPITKLLDCLRELRKSVERHTRASGRQGYLTFVRRFV